MLPRSIRPFLDVRLAHGPSFSSSGRRLAFLYDGPGSPQVYLIELREGDDADLAESWDRWPRQLTFFDDRVTFVRFLPGSEDLLVYGRDQGGDERDRIYLFDVRTGRETPISAEDEAIHVFGRLSRDGTRLGYVANSRDPRHFDIWLYDLETRESRMVHHADGWNRVVGFSPDGGHLYYAHYDTNTTNQVLVLDLADPGAASCLLGERGEGRHYTALSVHPETGMLFLAEDGETDRLRLATTNPATGEVHALHDPGWDVEETALSPDGQQLAYTVNREGVSQLFFHDLYSGAHRRVEGLPPGCLEGLTFSGDSLRVAFTLSADQHPTNVWIAPLHAPPFAATRAPVGRLPYHALHTHELRRYHSFDGLEVPCWVLGEGERAVVIIHGGPEGQSRPRYNPIAQYLASRGFRVFLPNVRGSSGYGRRYLGLDDVRKRMDSVRDIAALHDWIGEKQLADPTRVAVMGGSYGGFMVLAALTEYPERFAAGIDFVGIANFRTFLERTGAYRRKMREPEYGSLEADGDFLDSISPIHKADRIACPLFVAHGANDPRVPLEEAEQVVAALRERERPHEFLVFPDEGHGVSKRANRITLYERMAAFLERHMGA